MENYTNNNSTEKQKFDGFFLLKIGLWMKSTSAYFFNYRNFFVIGKVAQLFRFVRESIKIFYNQLNITCEESKIKIT